MGGGWRNDDWIAGGADGAECVACILGEGCQSAINARHPALCIGSR
jgi:hypothetical protein